MTFINDIKNTLAQYGITYTDEQIQVFIDNAKRLVDSPLLEEKQYTDYVRYFDGEVYCTDFYPVISIQSFCIDEKPVTLSHISPNGVLYLPYPYRGTLICQYTVGLSSDEIEQDLLPIVVAMITNKEGKNVSSITEGDVSVSYNNSTGVETSSLDSLVAKLRDKYGAMVRLI